MQNSATTSRSTKIALVSVASLAIVGACATRIPGNITSPGNGSDVSTVAAGTESVMPTPAKEPYFEFQVEKPASMQPDQRRMIYPPELRAAGVQGVVLASFVVDEQGVADMRTFEVLRSDHEQFSEAVRAAVGEIQYVPAEIGGKRVKQVVQQPFQFLLAGANAPPATSRSTPPNAANADELAPATKPQDSGEKADLQPASMLSESLALRYPPALREAKVEGEVVASYVVNADGTLDIATFKVLESDHAEFTAAVRAALAGMRYKPALNEKRAVRQLVQQRFSFSLAR